MQLLGEDCTFPVVELSGYWTDELDRMLRERVLEPFTMSLVGEDIALVIAAVNQGIDSHLEGCFCPSRGDSYKHGDRSITAQEDNEHWKKGDKLVLSRTLECVVSPDSLRVLIRRLMDSGMDEDPDGDGHSLASGICDLFNIVLI
jgi:hypothetical protein